MGYPSLTRYKQRFKISECLVGRSGRKRSFYFESAPMTAKTGGAGLVIDQVAGNLDGNTGGLLRMGFEKAASSWAHEEQWIARQGERGHGDGRGKKVGRFGYFGTQATKRKSGRTAPERGTPTDKGDDGRSGPAVCGAAAARTGGHTRNEKA